MKNYFIKAVALLLVVFSLLAFTSCGKNEATEDEVLETKVVEDGENNADDSTTEDTGDDASVESGKTDGLSSSKGSVSNKKSTGKNGSASVSDNSNSEANSSSNTTSSGNKNSSSSVNGSSSSTKNSSSSVNGSSSSTKNSSSSTKNSSSSANGQSSSGNGQSSSGNSGSNNGTKTSTTKDVSSLNVPANLKGTTIKYFYWWDPKQQMEREAIIAFEKKTGIKVVTEVGNYSTFTTELAAKIAAGNSPDIVRLLSNAMYQVKCLQPVTNSGYDFSEDFWWKKLMKDYTYDGKCYAVNATPKNAAILDTYMIYYNKRALKAAELEDPYMIWKKDHSKWTWAKLWSMCEEFLAANNNKSGYNGISFQYNNAYVRMFGCANYDYDSSQGKWVNYLKSPELEKRWKELLTYNSRNLSAINHDAQSFQRAKILFDGAGPFAARTRDQTHKALKDRKELGVVPIPSDSPYQLLYEYTAFGIPQGAKNAAAVPYYLRYVLDKKNYNLDNVYYDAQAKDVVEYTLSYPDDKYFFGENEIYDLRQALVNGTPDQVKSTLSSYYGKIQDAVDSSNDQIKYLSK